MLLLLYLSFLLGALQGMEIEEHLEGLDEMLEQAEREGSLDDFDLEGKIGSLGKYNRKDMKEEEVEVPSERQSSCSTNGTNCESLYGTCLSTSQSTRGCDIVSSDQGLCDRQGCRCCVDCDKDFQGTRCQEKGGRCRKEAGCRNTEITEPFYSCRSSSCSCCRRCVTSSACRFNNATYGFCASNPFFYTRFSIFFLDFSVRCTERQCRCVRYCLRDSLCRNANGYCVKNGVECRLGYRKFRCGCRDPRNCSCCVPFCNQPGRPNSLNCPEA